MNILSQRGKYRAREVFIPGGQPTLTYNPRKDLKLEDSLEDAKDNLCKLVMMTGSTKSGKTVLTNKVFPKTESIWFDGGSFSSESDFWLEINYQLNTYINESISEHKDKTSKLEAKGSIKSQLILFKTGGEISA